MKFLTLLILLVSFSSFGQEELNATPLYKSLYDANKEPNKVIRLSPVDFNPSKDGFALTNFKNLQALDLAYCEKAEIVPLGIKKLSQLKYLNISYTDIKFLYPYIKKLTNLKVIGAVNTKVSSKELQKISKKLGVTIITNSEQLPFIFSLESFDSNLSNSNSTTIESIQTENIQKIDGLYVYNPENIPLKENESVWMHTKDGKSYMCKKKMAYGIISEKGELVQLLPLNYEIHNQIYSEGLIGYSDKSIAVHKYGFLDIKGTVKIAPKFDKVKPFKNGVAIVKLDGKYGAINKQGDWVIQPKYDYLTDFVHAKYAFYKKDGKESYGVIDNAGNEVSSNVFSFEEYKFTLKNTFSVQQVFNAKLIASKKDQKWGFKSLQGEWKIQPIYDEIFDFKNGFAVVGKKVNGQILYGMINTNGKEVLPVEHFKISTAYSNHYNEEGNVSFSAFKDKKWTIYNENLEPIIGPISEINGRKIMMLLPFKEDVAQVVLYATEKEDCFNPASNLSQTTFINRKGEFLFAPRFMLADNVNQNGLIMFTNSNTRTLGTFYDPANKVNYENQLNKFNNDCGGVSIGFMNLKGEEVFKTEGKVPMKSASFGYENQNVLIETGYSKNSMYFQRFLKEGDKGTNTITYYGTMVNQTIPVNYYSEFKIAQPGYVQAYKSIDDKGRIQNLQFINLKTGEITYENKSTKNFSPINEGYSFVYPAGYIIELEEL